MKEERYFIVPDARCHTELPCGEALHAYRVLRLRTDDEIILIDGEGTFHRARLTSVSKNRCIYEIVESFSLLKGWKGSIHLAIAPTKNIDRIEWMAEKCTEIGFDILTFLNCRFSERREVRTDRIGKVVAAAVKQSHKPFIPVVNGMVDFDDFIAEPAEGRKYICHCYEEIERSDLFSELRSIGEPCSVTVMVGPEGDFSKDEVRKAMSCGFLPVTLGGFRLRTETAGLMVVSMYSMANRCNEKI